LNAPPTSVAIVEQHPAMRRRLSALLEAEPGVELVGHASDLDGLTALLHQHAPHVALIDQRALAPGGLKILPLLCATFASTAILITAFPEWPGHDTAVRALGAAGLIAKTADPDAWLNAIRNARAEPRGTSQ
jgi:DNA-binding NarL/FixJ family response regulator